MTRPVSARGRAFSLVVDQRARYGSTSQVAGGIVLQSLGEDIWTASGPLADVAGFAYPTRMAVIRLADGGLFIWSPIALSTALRTAVDALGPVRHVVAPNSLHHLSIGDWQRAYPDAHLYAAPGLRARRPDIAFDRELGDAPPGDWAADVDQVVVRGNRITTEVVFFHRQSRTVLFTDLIQQFDPGWFRGWRALVARLDGMTAAAPAVPRKFRFAFSDRRGARAALERILAWPIERMLAAHAPPITTGAHAVVAHAFRWLVR